MVPSRMGAAVTAGLWRLGLEVVSGGLRTAVMVSEERGSGTYANKTWFTAQWWRSWFGYREQGRRGHKLSVQGEGGSDASETLGAVGGWHRLVMTWANRLVTVGGERGGGNAGRVRAGYGRGTGGTGE